MRKKIRKKMKTKMKKESSYSLEIAKMDSVHPTPSPLLWRTYQNDLLLIFNSP
jgi:hypothetical protein